ncbi:hypothetical protein ACGFNX_40655 [Streptomyces sp. NPDC048723]|uniref:hypothetical protein n=1 Tax=Streptomyces sp. NPDC048723 TaxID=3365589 RepID=UPI00371E9B49
MVNADRLEAEAVTRFETVRDAMNTALAPNRMLAAMAAAATAPGATTVLEARDVQTWLRPRLVAALHQVGPAFSEPVVRRTSRL